MLLVLVGFLSVIFSASGRLCWVCFARIRKEPQDWLWFPSHASCWSRSPFCSSDSPVLRKHQHPDEVNKGRVLSSICPAEIHIPLGLVSYLCAAWLRAGQRGLALKCRGHSPAVLAAGVAPESQGLSLSARAEGERRRGVQGSPGGFSGEEKAQSPKSCSWHGFAASLKQKRNLEKFRIR